MAKKGIEIDVGMNAREFQRGTKDVEGALEDVAVALDDVAKDSDKAGDKLGDNLSDGAKDAEKSVDRLERSFKDLADGSKRATKDSADALKQNTKDATSQASRDLEELKDEALQNASETFSSFDGSVESFVDGIQGTFGGIVSNMGPVGAAMGAAAALGIGLLTAELQKSAEKAEEVRQQTNELALEIIEAGGAIENVEMADRLREWAFAVRDNKDWWEFWQESTISNLDAVDRATKYTKRSSQELFDAMSGQDPKAAVQILEEVEDRLSVVQSEMDNLSRAETGWKERRAELREEAGALSDVSEAIRERQGFQEKSIEQAQRLIEHTEAQQAADEQAAAAIELRSDAMSTLQSEVDAAASSWSDYMGSETKAIDPAGYIQSMEDRRAAADRFYDSVVSLAERTGMSAEEMQHVLGQGVDFAPMLESITGSGMEEKYAETVRNSVAAGQDIVESTPFEIQLDADTAKTEKAIDSVTSKKRTAEINATAKPTKASQDLDAVAAKKRTASIDVKANSRDAERVIDDIMRRDLTKTIYVDVVERKKGVVRW